MSRRPATPAAAASLQAAYGRALQDYLDGGGEEALGRAYELGRASVAAGRGLVEVSALHHAALAAALRRAGQGADLPPILARAREFLAEHLSPYEMAQGTFAEAIAALRRLNETLEGEIQRLAHDVHDELGQLLVAARLSLAEAAAQPPALPPSRVRELDAILDQTEEAVRRLSRELRPLALDDLGLVPALELLADGVSSRSGLVVRVDGALAGRPPPRVETALYRVAQEALTNAVRHAGARRVTIRLRQEAGLLLCQIRDDGAGFAAPGSPAARRGGLGLLGIRERISAVGGTVQVSSAPGQGCELAVRIPLEERHAEPGHPR
jgi:signal transduction histidine kinase